MLRHGLLCNGPVLSYSIRICRLFQNPMPGRFIIHSQNLSLRSQGMDTLLTRIKKERLPRHIAIIMDGNGRCAKEQGQDRLYGHYHGVESVRDIVEGCAELGIGYLTLYAFSTEN